MADAGLGRNACAVINEEDQSNMHYNVQHSQSRLEGVDNIQGLRAGRACDHDACHLRNAMC
jgi:hypothetical protein